MAIKQNAVDNFLASLGSLTKDQALANLALDARSYRWNAETVAAIKGGIEAHFDGQAYWAQFRPDNLCNCGMPLTGMLGSFRWGLQSGEGKCSNCDWPVRGYHDFGDHVVEKVRAYLPEYVEEA